MLNGDPQTKQMPDFNDLEVETRLRRFFYIRKERPVYHTGNFRGHAYYHKESVKSIQELAERPEKHDLILYLIHEAQSKGLVQYTDTLIFALALCAQQNEKQNLCRKAYDIVKVICKTPEQFILFVKFCTGLRRFYVTKGWGHGLKRAIKSWYDSHSPMELAEIFARGKGRYGWKHKDIIKLAHIASSKDKERMIAYEYTLYGLKKLKEKYAGKELSETEKQILEYIEKIEEFKHCEDEVTAAGLVDTLDITLDHVPGHLLKSKDVWSSLVSSMSLTDLLVNLQRIHNLEFLKPNSLITTKVLEAINEQNVTKENIHPAVFLVTVKNYECSGKPLTFEKRKVKEQAKVQLPPPPKPNKKITDALNKMLNFSFSLLQPTNVNYMVTINTSKTMEESGCWHCGNVNAVEAGCLIALSLLRAERNVTVATFTNNGIKCVDVDPNTTLMQMMRELAEPTVVETVDLSKPMTWAAKEKKVIDIFINIVDQVYEKSDNSEKGIVTYRSNMNLPNAKLVNCAMCTPSAYEKENYDKNILTICGFDETVPKIIEAFARSYF